MNRIDSNTLLNKSIKKHTSRFGCSAIKTESKLIQIIIEMFDTSYLKNIVKQISFFLFFNPLTFFSDIYEWLIPLIYPLCLTLSFLTVSSQLSYYLNREPDITSFSVTESGWPIFFWTVSSPILIGEPDGHSVGLTHS